MQDTNQQPDVPVIYIKPTWFDLVLEGVAVLLLLALWAIVLGSFVFPDWYPERFDQSGDVFMAMLATLMGVIDFHRTRFLTPVKSKFFFKITKENADRQYRLRARFLRYSLVWILLFLIGMSIRSFLPRENVIQDNLFVIYMGLFVCLCLWGFIRSWMLK